MAAFRIDQVSPGPGTPGVSRHDLIPGEVITLTATSPVGPGITYAWEILDKIGSVAVLSAATGTTVTIGNAGLVTRPAAFRIKLTVDDNGVITEEIRVCSVRTLNHALRTPLFAEAAPASAKLGSNNPDLSDDNAVYTNRAGLGVTEKNWRGWSEWAYEIVQAIESAVGGGGTLQDAYVAGNTVLVTNAEGSVALSSAAASTEVVLSVATNAAASGDGLRINNLGSGDAAAITQVGAGDALVINNNGSGEALAVFDGAIQVVQITSIGAVNILGGNDGAVGSSLAIQGGAGITSSPGGSVTLTGGVSPSGQHGAAAISTGRGASAAAAATDGAVLRLTQSGTSGASVDLFAGSIDPTGGSGVVAPEGSLYLRDGGTLGQLYVKTGAANAAWSLVATGVITTTLQAAYEGGNAISMIDAEGSVVFSSAASSTLPLLTLTSNAAASGDALTVTNNGTGRAFSVLEGAIRVVEVTSVGAVNIIGGNNGTVGSGVLVQGGEGITSGVGGSVSIVGGTSPTGQHGATTISTGRGAATSAAATVGSALRLVQSGASGATVDIFAGSVDPTGGSGVVAPEGSMYLQDGGTTGRAFLKTGAGNTAWSQLVSGIGGVLNNVTASTDPTTSNDSTQGYSAGSLWLRSQGGPPSAGFGVWICKSAGVGIADWRRIQALNTFTQTVAPTSNEDANDGFAVGSIYGGPQIGYFVCTNADTGGSAAWARISLLRNYAAAIGNPGVGNDSSQGYAPGSLWLDTTAGDAAYVCLLATVGAAYWLPFSVAKGGILPVGAASLAGSDSTGFARVDHVHAHGNQLGGALHADVIAAGAAGFMSGADKTKLDGIATAALNNLTAIVAPSVGNDSTQGYGTGSVWLDTVAGIAYECIRPTVGAAEWLVKPYTNTTTPQPVGAANAPGSSTALVARVDHVHAHGNQLGGALHADVIASAASGFMTGADKAKLNGVANGATADTPFASTPAAVGSGTPGQGASALFARGDHNHPFRFATRPVTGTNATLTADDAVVLLDSSGASRTLTLPAHAEGLRLYIVDAVGTFDSFPVTVARAAGGNIQGLAASYVYSVPWGALQLVSVSGNWHILGG